MDPSSLYYIHPNAIIADNVIIEPFVSISDDVIIEEGCWIGSKVSIMEGARIGKNCKIYPGAVISAPPQDLKYKGEKTTLRIGSHSIIREYATLNRGTIANGETKIGEHCLIMAYAHIAHDCIIGNHVVIANAVNMGGHVKIDDWAIVGGMTAIHQFVQIGKHAMIDGKAIVRKDIPPYTKAARNPLVFVGVNTIGLRRRGFTDKQIKDIKQSYREIYLNHKNTSQSIAHLKTIKYSTLERNEIIFFIENSSRGIMPSYINKRFD